MALTETFALDIQGVTKSFGELKALRGIDLQVDHGDFLALLGPNGAGKSTLINIIMRLISADQGSVRVQGHSTESETTTAMKLLGLMPQEFNFNIFESVEQILITQAGYYGVKEQVARKNMAEFIEPLGLADKLKKRTGSLSGGMKRRFMLARSLIHNPKVLILDEPTAGVDVELRRSIWEFIEYWHKQDKTVILTTHYLEEAEQLCKNLAIIQNGKIVKKDSLPNMLDLLGTRFYLLDLDEEATLPETTSRYKIEKVDDLTIQLSLPQGVKLNEVWTMLNEQKISVKNIRLRANPLEELFMQFTNGELK